VPDLNSGGIEPFDFIICTTKNIPDAPPILADLIRPAVTPNRSIIVLVQNGLNIEKPILEAFPSNICLSGVSLCGANEPNSGHITQDDPDRLYIGAFDNPNIEKQAQANAAHDFVKLYSASGKAKCWYEPDVLFVRWRKLMYNAVWNPICALTDLDTTRLRLGSEATDPTSPLNLLVIPAMNEIRAAALAAAKVKLDESLVQSMIDCDPIEIFCQPSMMQDVRKKRFIEYENILGEALKEGEAAGASMPTIKVLYGMCKAVQWRTREAQGLVDPVSLLKTKNSEKLSTVTGSAN